MSSTIAVSRLLILILIGSFLLTCADVALAQSGRRPHRPPPPALVEPEPPTTTVKPTRKLQPALDLTVGLDDRGGFANLPSYFYTDAVQTIIARLSQDSSTKVNDAGYMTRGDAMKSAKGGKDGYVVYLQLRLDTMNPDARSNNANDVVVEYTVFAPNSAQIATSGRTYARAYQNKGVILRPGTSGVYKNDRLNQAAKAAAEQILAYFKNHKPTDTNLDEFFKRSAFRAGVKCINQFAILFIDYPTFYFQRWRQLSALDRQLVF
jgi:hypothetical protein